MFTLQHIVLWEALANKSFAKLDGQNPDDVLMLMYVCKNTERKYTFPVWSEVYKKYQQKDIEKFAREISEDIAYCNQFEHAESDTKRKSNEQDDVPTYASVIGRIITDAGIPAQWVLAQTVEWLPILAGFAESHEERRIENDRFWAFVLTAPYRDKKSNIHTPEKWLPMPFDKKKPKAKLSDKEVDEARKVFARWAEEKKQREQEAILNNPTNNK